jgi:hypothetical protein
MENVLAHRILRILNTSLHVSIPAVYVRERGLEAGDHVVLIRDGDELRLRFVRTRDLLGPQDSKPQTAA